jgi:hypothetical protein
MWTALVHVSCLAKPAAAGIASSSSSPSVEDADGNLTPVVPPHPPRPARNGTSCTTCRSLPCPQWNELHHLQITEALGGDRLWVDRFMA